MKPYIKILAFFLALATLTVPLLLQNDCINEVLTELTETPNEEDSVKEAKKLDKLVNGHSYEEEHSATLGSLLHKGPTFLYLDPCPDRTTPPPERG